MCGLILEMKDEPELKAWVRDGEVDAVQVRKCEGLIEARVLVTVEDAPDLAVSSPTSLPRVASLGSLCPNRSLDELKGGASKGVDLDPYSIAAPAVPVCEIHILSTKTLDEHEQLEPNRSRRGTPSRRPARLAAAQLRSPDVMSSAVTSNSWRDRIGVAP